MIENEIWRPVAGYEGLYEVSSFGRVKSLGRTEPIFNSVRFRKDKIMRQKLTKFGYLEATLSKNGKPSTKKIHRLVAEAFLPNPEGLPQVNHKDEDKTNNRVENLEWCSAKYNMNYGSVKRRVGEKHSKPVAQLSLEGKIIKVYKSAAEAGRNGVAMQQHITDVCNHKGNHYTAGGFRWEYV